MNLGSRLSVAGTGLGFGMQVEAGPRRVMVLIEDELGRDVEADETDDSRQQDDRDQRADVKTVPTRARRDDRWVLLWLRVLLRRRRRRSVIGVVGHGPGA